MVCLFITLQDAYKKTHTTLISASMQCLLCFPCFNKNVNEHEHEHDHDQVPEPMEQHSHHSPHSQHSHHSPPQQRHSQQQHSPHQRSKKSCDDILAKVFPQHISDYIRSDTYTSFSWRDIAKSHSGVTVLFCDIVGFTEMCRHTPPMCVMQFLHTFYTMLDDALDAYPLLYKVETIGDCIVCASHLFDVTGTESECAMAAFSFAKDAVRIASLIRMPGSMVTTKVRIGINTGDVTTGVVGTRMPRFTLFGDTVNTAARLQGSANPGQIVISQSTGILIDVAEGRDSAHMNLKGIGELDVFLYDSTQVIGLSNGIAVSDMLGKIEKLGPAAAIAVVSAAIGLIQLSRVVSLDHNEIIKRSCTN